MTGAPPHPPIPCRNPSCVCITDILHQFAESLGNAIDAKDPHTRRHSEEVAELSRELARILGCAQRQLEVIHVAGHLHDIGKIGVPDAALGKNGPLDDREWEALRRHPGIGADIVRPVQPLAEAGVVEMILHHHERYDGRGYPHGLAGTAIPFGARVITLADSLSAMLQDRPYRRALGFETAVAEIAKGRGTQFDPEIAEAFLDSRAHFQALCSALAGAPQDSGAFGLILAV